MPPVTVDTSSPIEARIRREYQVIAPLGAPIFTPITADIRAPILSDNRSLPPSPHRYRSFGTIPRVPNIGRCHICGK